MSASEEPSGYVVFHADDFGMNAAVNSGIETAFREGLLTSTSLLANAPGAEAACQAWPSLVSDLASRALVSIERRRQVQDPLTRFDLGIHLNLTQGRPLTQEKFPAELLDENGCFPGIGKIFARINHTSSPQLNAVEAELRAQIEWMSDRGLAPTHLNGHQYIELIPRVAALVPKLLRDYSIPIVRVAFERGLFRNVLLRGDVTSWGLGLIKQHFAKSFRHRMKEANVRFPDRFFGTSHAGRINETTLIQFLDQSGKNGCTEIGIHPATEITSDAVPESDPWFDPLAELRPGELRLLCSQELANQLKSRRLTPGRLTQLPTQK